MAPLRRGWPVMDAKAQELRAVQSRAERREMRAIIQKIKRDQLTKSQKMLLEVIVNLWFAHRFGEGVIRPGRSRLAKRCDVSLRTVETALAEFRAHGIVEAVAFLKGGSKATRYIVHLDKIRQLRGGAAPKARDGHLARLDDEPKAGVPGENCSADPRKNCSRKEDVPLTAQPASSVESPAKKEEPAAVHLVSGEDGDG